MELPYERPYPLHIPTDAESNQTRAKILGRKAQITALHDKIMHMETRFKEECEEAAARMRPAMDALHNQVLAIQQKMATLWDLYSEDRQKAERAVQTVVTNLKVQIHILEHENTKSAGFHAPIRRLPVELLAEIFLLEICGNNRPPLELARVSQSWRAVILSMPRMWSTFWLSTWTKAEKIDFILERSGRLPLDVEIDTGADVFKIMDEKEVRFAGIESGMSVASRWRNLVVTSFPSRVDIDAHWTPKRPSFTFGRPINALESFRIKNPCEDSILFEQLLDVVGNSSHERLVDMELSSPNAIYHLSQPDFSSIFRRLVTFKANFRAMPTEVDILRHFEQLETLEAFHLRLPTYTIETDLPLVRTLKQITIKTVSVQWMAGRTFSKLEECIITWPRCPETLAPGGGVDLPVCTHFTYDDHVIDTLPNFRIPKLDTLIVRNEAWNKRRGSTQLAAVWEGVGHVTPLKPRVLRLEMQCHDQHLINALEMLPDLEELYLGLVRPNGLGKRFFGALQAKKRRSSRSSSVAYVYMLCPNLRTFGIRFRRWIRETERDEITPLLHKVIESRRKFDAPLVNVKLWQAKDIPEEQFLDLCRLSKDRHLDSKYPIALETRRGYMSMIQCPVCTSRGIMSRLYP